MDAWSSSGIVQCCNGFHLLAITETWLDSSILDSELEAGLADHTWFRRDRGSLGGGVTCAVRSSL